MGRSILSLTIKRPFVVHWCGRCGPTPDVGADGSMTRSGQWWSRRTCQSACQLKSAWLIHGCPALKPTVWHSGCWLLVFFLFFLRLFGTCARRRQLHIWHPFAMESFSGAGACHLTTHSNFKDLKDFGPPRLHYRLGQPSGG